MADLDLNDDDDNDNENLTQIISDIQSLSSPLSESTLISLLSLSPDDVTILFRRVSTSSLLSSLTSTMDSPTSSLSILAAKAYVFLLLSPSSPLLSLFTPLAFLSFLRALRRAVKAEPSVSVPVNGRKRKGSDRRGEGRSGNQVEEVMELLDLVVKKVRLDVAHDGRKFLVETMVTVLELAGD